jgi:hypothetical protein
MKTLLTLSIGVLVLILSPPAFHKVYRSLN